MQLIQNHQRSAALWTESLLQEQRWGEGSSARGPRGEDGHTLLELTDVKHQLNGFHNPKLKCCWSAVKKGRTQAEVWGLILSHEGVFSSSSPFPSSSLWKIWQGTATWRQVEPACQSFFHTQLLCRRGEKASLYESHEKKSNLVCASHGVCPTAAD